MKKAYIIVILITSLSIIIACLGNNEKGNKDKANDTYSKIENTDSISKVVDYDKDKEEESVNKEVATKTYNGAWFSVKYPASFTVKPSLKYKSEEGYTSVFFESPDKLVEFYVFSSTLGIEPTDIKIKNTEKLVSKNKIEKMVGIKKAWTIAAKDGSYMRSYKSVSYGDGLIDSEIIGIKYKNDDAYKKYKADYLVFKNSLEQYADN